MSHLDRHLDDDYQARCGNKKVWAVVALLCLIGGSTMLMYALSTGGCACAGSCIGLADVACVGILDGCGHKARQASSDSKKFECNFKRFSLDPLKQKLEKGATYVFSKVIRRRRTPFTPEIEATMCAKEPTVYNGDCRACLARRRSSKHSQCTRRRRAFEGTANYWCADTNKCSDKQSRDKNCKKSFDNSLVRNYLTNTVTKACGPARRTEPAKASATQALSAAAQQDGIQAGQDGAANRKLLVAPSSEERRLGGTTKVQSSVLSKVKGECKDECRYPGLTIPGFICLVFFGCLNIMFGLCALFPAVPCFCCVKYEESDDMTTVVPMENFKNMGVTPPIAGFNKGGKPSPKMNALPGAQMKAQMSPQMSQMNTSPRMSPSGAPQMCPHMLGSPHVQLGSPQIQSMDTNPQMMFYPADQMMAGQQMMASPELSPTMTGKTAASVMPHPDSFMVQQQMSPEMVQQHMSPVMNGQMQY